MALDSDADYDMRQPAGSHPGDRPGRADGVIVTHALVDALGTRRSRLGQAYPVVHDQRASA